MTAALYALTLRTHGRRGRLLALFLAGLLAVVVVAAFRGGSANVVDDSTGFIAAYGFALFVPVSCLAIGSAVFGDLTDDSTLVYIWLRPVPRWILVAGPYAATLTITVPVVTVPLIAAAAVSGDADLVSATLLASVVAAVAYSALFLALGLRTKRALLWGIGYILVWEGFVASIGGLASQLAIRSYPESIIADITGRDSSIGDDPLVPAVVIPLVAAFALSAYTTWRLRRTDVD